MTKCAKFNRLQVNFADVLILFYNRKGRLRQHLSAYKLDSFTGIYYVIIIALTILIALLSVLPRKMTFSTEETNILGHPKLKPKNPVPKDIEVSQQTVKEVGLLPIADLAKQ